MDNIVHRFLRDNFLRLQLADFGLKPGQITSLLLTPRFAASRHVIFLIMRQGQPDPVLVAKIPRLDEVSDSVQHEVKILQIIQGLREGGINSIPRVIAFETYQGVPILLETALAGPLLSPALIRKNHTKHSSTVLDWLAILPQSPTAPEDWYAQFVEQSLTYFKDHMPVNADEASLLEKTGQLCESLRDSKLPYVLEHGDLSHPNLIKRADGQEIGVVDWELAQIEGMVGADLFFFLTYVAFCLHDANAIGKHLAAHQQTFYGEPSWAVPLIHRYAYTLGIPQSTLAGLFILCWLRYVNSFIFRLHVQQEESGGVSPQTLNTVRTNRYYQLWQYAVHNIDHLNFV